MVRLSISIPFLIVACLLSASLAAPVAEEQKPKQNENAKEQKQQTLLSSINAQNIPEPFAKMLSQVKPADLDALPELFDDVKSGKIATGAELVEAIKARSPGLFNLAVSSVAEDKLAASTFYNALGDAKQKLINNYINPPMETGAQIRDKLEENKATLRDAMYKAIPDLKSLLKDVNLDLFDSVDSLMAAINDKTADEAACRQVMDSLSADTDALNSLVDKLMGYVPAQVKDALDSVDASELDGLLQVALSTVTMQYKTLEQLTQDLKAKCPTIMEQVQKQLDPLTDAMPVSLKDDLNKVDANEQSNMYQIVSNGVAAKYSTLDAVAQDLKEKCPNTIELAKMLFSKVNDAYNNVASDVDQAVKDLAKEIAQLVLDLHQKQMDTIMGISKDDIGAFRDAVLKTVNSVFEQKKEQNNMQAQPMLTKQQLRERTASMVEKINKNQKQWVAEVNPRFADLTKEEMRHWLGLAVDPIVKPKNALRQKKQVADSENGTTPEPEEPAPFDAREQWPECADVINQIQDQSHCGSCWAVSSASVMSDRICIGSKGAKKVNVSAEDVLACTFWSLGCSGGWPSQAFAFWADNGACTGSGYTAHKGCKPYPFPPSKDTNESYSTPKCTKRCENRQYKLNYRKDKHFGLEPQQLKDGANEDIMQAIREGGPVEADMMVYDDLFHYKSGVYERSIEAEKAGGHAVRVIGWGVEVNENGGDDLPYWLVANSWGEEWGENGFFRIIRGEDDCGIETSGINFADASLD